jgi:hypothetical protein
VSEKTRSERLVEDWLGCNGITWRRLPVAVTPGHRRPDYAIKIAGNWCIIEVKEITPNDDDRRTIENFRAGIVASQWVAPGKRLRPAIRSGEGQLRKFSGRGFATIICLVDTTASFYDAEFHVRAALYGDQTLCFEVLSGSGTASFIGSGPGRNAMLRRHERTTISAVAVLRCPASSDVEIDFYHNPFAAIPIDPNMAAPLVTRQVADGWDTHKPDGPTWFDVRDNPDYADFFIDPDAAMERVVREILGFEKAKSGDNSG